MSDLPSGWVETTVGDVATEVRSGFASGRHNSTGAGIPHLRPMNVNRLGHIDLDEVKYVDRMTDDRRLQVGDILFNNTNSPALVGKTAVFRLSGEFAFSNHMTRVRTVPGVLSTFVALQLHYQWQSGQLAHLITNHVNQASIASGVLAARVQLRIPPTGEQARIVAAIEEQFSRLDQAEHLLRIGCRRFNPLTSSIIDAATTGFPTKPLGELIREPLRNGHSAKRSSTGSIPVFTLTAVTARDFSEHNTKLTDADAERVEDLWVEPGDIFVERSNTPELVGTTALYKGPAKMAIFPDLLIRIRVGPELLPEYAELGLRSTRLRRYFQRTAKGIAGSMPKIDQGTLLAAEVPLPPVADQVRLVEEAGRQLSIVESMTTAVDHALIRSGNLRRSVMERAFSGDLVPQDPGDEPSSQLLADARADREVGSPTPRRRKRA